MGRGVVSSRVTLLLRSAEIKPYWSQRSPSPLQSFTSGCVAMLTLSSYYNIHIYFSPPYVLPLQSPSKESSAGDKEFFSGFALLPNLETLPYVVARARQRRVRLNLLQATGVFSDSDEPYRLQSQDNFLTLRIVGHRSVPTYIFPPVPLQVLLCLPAQDFAFDDPGDSLRPRGAFLRL